MAGDLLRFALQSLRYPPLPIWVPRKSSYVDRCPRCLAREAGSKLTANWCTPFSGLKQVNNLPRVAFPAGSDILRKFSEATFQSNFSSFRLRRRDDRLRSVQEVPH